MTSDEILTVIVRNYPWLLPNSSGRRRRKPTNTPMEDYGSLACELATLINCWDKWRDHMPVEASTPARSEKGL